MFFCLAQTARPLGKMNSLGAAALPLASKFRYGFRAFSSLPASASSSSFLQRESSSGAASLERSMPDEVRPTLRGFGGALYRWLDLTGFLTRWNDRKTWVLELDPMSRLAAPLVTEYERKMIMFMGFNAYLFAFISFWLTWKAHAHLHVKPPLPSPEGQVGLDGRKKDFTWHGRLFLIEPKERCKECRWLDLECKKQCFAALKDAGHSLKLFGGHPLETPRKTLLPPHEH